MGLEKKIFGKKGFGNLGVTYRGDLTREDGKSRVREKLGPIWGDG